MTTGYLSAELSATCNALGYNDGAKYYTDPYVRETVKDLIRYLRRDDDDNQIRRHLGNAKVLQTDLIPIMIHHSDKEDLFDVVLRLVVNLTNPALLVYHEEIPIDKSARNHYLQIISHLQSYKEAFIEQKVWDVLAKKLGDLLQIEYQDRDEDVGRTMERILILARNVLNVPVDPELEKRPDNDASIHDQVLWALHQAGMVDMFLYIASTENEQQFYLHVLEIVTLMLREQKPSALASSAIQRSVEEKEKDETELLAIRQAEITQKQQKLKKYTGSRHSRFGGTFVLKNMKSISDNDVIYHKTLDKVSNLTFDSEKQKVKTPKNLMAMQYQSGERKSAFSIRLFLKEFCVEFMNGAYNPMMRRVKENLVRAVGQPNDESYYFWAMKFFMEFNRKYNFEVKLISETMSRQTFHFVQTQLETWHEMMVTDKKKIPLWSRRMHLGVKAYQELLHTLMAMDKSPDSTVRESSRVIKSNVFYVPEYRELIIMLFNLYNEVKFSKEYLKDLVQTAHIFLKMLEHYSSRYRNLMVQTKAKTRAKKKHKSAKKSAVAVNLETVWDQVGPQLSIVLQSQDGIPTDIVPFDAASDLDMDQQKVEAMKKIQLELKQGNFEEAVGLLRTAREVWPENDCFGNSTMQADEEFLAMREIFMANIGQPTDIGTNNRQIESEDNEENEEDEQAANMVAHEQNFNFFDFSKRFVSSKIVAALCQLLSQFEKNSDEINHCVAKLLHRIVWDCKCPAILFQASVFRVFQRLMVSTNPAHKELTKLGKYVMRKFYEVSLINRKVFLELLFWKSATDAYEIEFGYGQEKTHSSKNVWTEEQEDELRRLFMEFERDDPEPDCVEWIMKNMIKQDRSKRSVTKKLKEMYLWVGNKNKSKSSRPPKDFTEAEEEELKTLFDEYKNALDPIACIMGMLTVHRPKNRVIEKLLAMGLVDDRKQLFKKRGKRSKRSGDNNDSDLDSDTDSDSSVQKVNNKTLSRTRQVSSGQIAAILRKVVDAELKEALVWLQSCLKDVLEDLDDGDDNEEGTALLPLSETSMCAMDNPIFLQLLDIIDIHKPTDQEVYWRIPGYWKAEDLTKRITVIEDAIEGRLESIVEEDKEEITFQAVSPDISSQTNKKKHVKKKKSVFGEDEFSRDTDSQGRADSSEENKLDRFTRYLVESSNETGGAATVRKKTKSKEMVLDSSSDNDSNLTNHNGELNSAVENGENKPRRRRIVDSSSDDEDFKRNNDASRVSKNEDNIQNSTEKITDKSSSDDEHNSAIGSSKQIEHKKKIKRRKSFKSSSDEGNYNNSVRNGDSYSNKKIKRRRRTLIDSSSEDEGLENNKNSSFVSRNEDTNNTVRRIDTSSSDEEMNMSSQKSSVSLNSDNNKTVVDNSSLQGEVTVDTTSFTVKNQQDKKKADKRSIIESSSDEEKTVHTSTQKSSVSINSELDNSSLEGGTSVDTSSCMTKEKKQKRSVVETSSDEESSVHTSTQKSSVSVNSDNNDSFQEDTSVDTSSFITKVKKQKRSVIETSSDEESSIHTSTQKSSISVNSDNDSKLENSRLQGSTSFDMSSCITTEKQWKRSDVETSSDEESVVHTSTQKSSVSVSIYNNDNKLDTLKETRVKIFSQNTEIGEDLDIINNKRKRPVVDSSSDDDSKKSNVNLLNGFGKKKSRTVVSDESD